MWRHRGMRTRIVMAKVNTRAAALGAGRVGRRRSASSDWDLSPGKAPVRKISSGTVWRPVTAAMLANDIADRGLGKVTRSTAACSIKISFYARPDGAAMAALAGLVALQRRDYAALHTPAMPCLTCKTLCTPYFA
jgi:hypothetical protein